MIKVEILDKAIAAHAGWKTRLRTAASSGKFDGTADNVKVDDECEFGKWLYGSELSTAEKQTEHYRTVKQLHAKFHQDAAKVVDLAISGHKDEAEKALGIGGSHTKSSTALTQAMVKWRESLR